MATENMNNEKEHRSHESFAGAPGSATGAEEAAPELLPCPFCGAYEVVCFPRDVGWLHKQTTVRRIVAVCQRCGAQGPAFGPMSMTGEAVAKRYWQRRPESESPNGAKLSDASWRVCVPQTELALPP